MTDQEFLTKEKFDELQVELDFLKTTRRKEIAENLEYARSLGDISEKCGVPRSARPSSRYGR